MTGKITNSIKPGKRGGSTGAPVPQGQPTRSRILGNEIAQDYILSGLVLIFGIYYSSRLFNFLGQARLWADENFHAYIARVIHDTGGLPVVLPETIFGEFEYAYPPLFHVFSALVMALAGPDALKYINLSLLVLFLAVFYYLIRRHFGNSEALLACLLLSCSPIIAVNSVRFMTEMLSMVLVFFSFFYMATAIEKKNAALAVISGISTGLLILSKQVGIVVFGYYGILLPWLMWKRRRSVRFMLYILGTAFLVVAPYLAWALYHRLEVFGFISLFLGTRPEWAAEAVRSFRRYDSGLIEFGYLFYQGNGVVFTLSLIVPLIQFIRARGRSALPNYVFLLFVFLSAVMIVWHITNQRHLITLLPMVAVLFGWGLNQIIRNRWVLRGIVLALLVIAAISAHRMTDYRQYYNPPGEFLEVTGVIRQQHSGDGRTLGIYPFDTVMYTGKPVIWPSPDLRHIPLDIFQKQTANAFYRRLKQYQIRFILIDFGYTPQTESFNGRNYPLPFIDNCDALLQQRRAVVMKLTESKQILLIKVI